MSEWQAPEGRVCDIGTPAVELQGYEGATHPDPLALPPGHHIPVNPGAVDPADGRLDPVVRREACPGARDGSAVAGPGCSGGLVGSARRGGDPAGTDPCGRDADIHLLE